MPARQIGGEGQAAQRQCDAQCLDVAKRLRTAEISHRDEQRRRQRNSPERSGHWPDIGKPHEPGAERQRDIAGAYGSALLCRRLGIEATLGGVSWERLPIDPLPGPRPVREIVDAREVAPGVMLAGPATRSDRGVVFAESHMAEFLGHDTLLVDPTGGPRQVAEGLLAAADLLGAELLISVDVGGDVLGDGSEPGLACLGSVSVRITVSHRPVSLPRRSIVTIACVTASCR